MTDGVEVPNDRSLYWSLLPSLRVTLGDDFAVETSTAPRDRWTHLHTLGGKM